ncbi:hypothetical protein BOX15_Mlig026396g1 [Macrostomum lignano]|uniref:Amiloride-sensitive sodium channel n=1 Tax=Macrostomum lignano TaxID=282301 RepID=A0A267ECQ9_9PLAT|nr:hypothetical protein BOX15_Mlig026396g1 [Macrostomum lignano]
MDIYLNVPGLFDNYNISHLPYNEDDTTGARVCVHTPLSWPYTEEIGIDIEPGTKTMIDVSPTKLKLLPNYGGQVCTEHNLLEEVMEAYTDMGSTKFAYTSKFCKDLHLQNLTVDRCNCIDPRKPYPPSLHKYQFCGKMNGSDDKSLNETLHQLRCADNIELDNSYSASQHDCALSCETCQYLYQTSQSLWPTKNKEVEYYQQMLKPLPKLREKYKAYDHIQNLSRVNAIKSRKLLMKEDDIRNNFVRLHIFRSDFSASEKSMALKTTKESMVSQVGGIFHLLTGITFACVVEVLECLYYLLKKTLLPRSNGPNHGVLLQRLRRRPHRNDSANNCQGVDGSAYEMQKLQTPEPKAEEFNHHAIAEDGAASA